MGVKGKFYNMKECFNACGDDDAPFIEGVYNSSAKNTKKQLMRFDDHRPGINQALSDQWQIKRAEPKVLSAEEWFKTTGYESEAKPYAIHNFKAGDENGQLREWKRLNAWIRGHLLRCGTMPAAKEMFENLKPPITE